MHYLASMSRLPVACEVQDGLELLEDVRGVAQRESESRRACTYEDMDAHRHSPGFVQDNFLFFTPTYIATW